MEIIIIHEGMHSIQTIKPETCKATLYLGCETGDYCRDLKHWNGCSFSTELALVFIMSEYMAVKEHAWDCSCSVG
jgi:hypothetical protein